MLGAVALGAGGAGSDVGGGVVEVVSLPDDPPPPHAVNVSVTSRQASLLAELMYIVVACGCRPSGRDHRRCLHQRHHNPTFLAIHIHMRIHMRNADGG